MPKRRRLPKDLVSCWLISFLQLKSASSPSPVLRTAVVCGVSAGLLCIAWVLFLHVTGNNPYGPKRTLSQFFPAIAAVVSQVLLRRYYTNGPGLWKSLGVGIATAGISAVVAALGLYTFARVTGPEPIASHLAEMRQLLANAKDMYFKEANGKQQYEATLRNLARTPEAFAQDEFLKKFVLGFILAIPGGVFLRK